MIGFIPGAFFFYFLAAVTLGSAAGVAFSRNILYSGFALLGTLAGVAGLYLYLAADFLGVAQLLIYIGGILVLILFAVLLTNRIGDIKISNRSAGLAFGVPTIAGLVVLLIRISVATPWPTTEAVAAPTTARLGDAFLREFLMPFEVISLVLLMALVGAMVIARRAAKEKRR
ncbi:MAG TPA: NADH-quinone oxidoreductase subunit J [Polyangia bacterium]|nr:NADH-quinone oxidoreductase subunit J [Polyangia bacterium]